MIDSKPASTRSDRSESTPAAHSLYADFSALVAGEAPEYADARLDRAAPTDDENPSEETPPDAGALTVGVAASENKSALPPLAAEHAHAPACSATLAAMLVSSIAVGCAKNSEPPATDGVLTENQGEITRLSDREAREICQTQFCEPNYIQKTDVIRESAGTTGALADGSPIADHLDYSRKLMGVTEAWKKTLGSREIVVAVVDSGVEYTHSDLSLNIWSNPSEARGKVGADDDGDGLVDDVYGFNFVANTANGNADADHGTHVAGIIGAQLNGFGSAGVSPQVRIMPLTFIGPQGTGSTLDAIKAINYATDHGANIISNSWGSPGQSQLLGKAIARAINQGIIVVAAAGNDANPNDTQPYYPAGYPGVVAVASSDEQDALSSFSNYGKESVMIAAPGSHIYSTVPGNKWAVMSGTSMAAPQVSGALALALSLNPQIGAPALLDKLCASSRKILTDSVKCGRLDVAALVNAM